MPECYKCRGPECEADFSVMRTCETQKECFTQTKIHDHENGQILSYERGCEDLGPKAHFSMCHIYEVSKKELFHDLHLNCCDTDRCNNVSFQKLQLTRPYSDSTKFGLGSFLMLLSFISIFGFLLFVTFKAVQKRRAKKKKTNYDYEFGGLPIKLFDLDDTPKRNMRRSSISEELAVPLDKELSSDLSTILNQRTLSKDIKLEAAIGNGRYGQVWRAKWKSDTVAVKILYSQDYASFTRELEIYRSMNSSVSRHILYFIASDITSSAENFCTELWLVTDYLPLGSLYDFLTENTLTFESALSIMNSILAGMHYLHQDMFSTSRKPAIAHRDVKSKNILMITETECVIADFGLAVSYHKDGRLNVPVNHRVGTKRYMAPEILDDTFNPAKFSSYLMADVYSIGLVLWEIIHRIEMEPNIKAQQFRVAYQDIVQPDPSVEEMCNVVCKHNIRPKIEDSLFNEKALAKIVSIIQESWKTKPTSRVSVYYMKRMIADSS